MYSKYSKNTKSNSYPKFSSLREKMLLGIWTCNRESLDIWHKSKFCKQNFCLNLISLQYVKTVQRFNFFTQIWSKYVGSSAKQKLCTNKTTKDPSDIYLFKVNNWNFWRRCGICSKVTIKKFERHHWRRAGVIIVNFEHISHLFQYFYCWLWTGKYMLGTKIILFICFCSYFFIKKTVFFSEWIMVTFTDMATNDPTVI